MKFYNCEDLENKAKNELSDTGNKTSKICTGRAIEYVY